MRYSAQHKSKMRERIIAEAGRQFRRFGYTGVSIDSLMARAGLTRGGFYGYFKSKAALFAEVIRSQHEYIDRLRGRRGTSVAELRDEAIEIAGHYVNPAYRRGVIKGCSIASLAMESCRSPAPVRRAYAASLTDLIEEFSRGLPDAETLDERAVETVIVSVGALLLANAADVDEALSDQISAVAQRAIERALNR